MNIRTLRADEIDCRVQSVKEKGFALLLYKNARVDMAILDETFGVFGWQRKHELINNNLFCTVSIFDEKNKIWIDKQDVGTESYTEKEKGQASDSFKRACFNIGIGRELYTSPFIWISDQGDVNNYNGKLSVKTSFSVSQISYNEQREIVQLVITDNKGKERYKLGKPYTSPTNGTEKGSPITKVSSNGELVCSDCNVDIEERVRSYSINKFGKALCYNCQKKVK